MWWTLLSSLPGLTPDDDLKAQLLNAYRLPATHPVAAAAQLGLDSNATCAASFTTVNVQFYIDSYHVLDEHANTFGFDGYLRAYWVDPRLSYTVEPGCSEELLLTRDESLRLWRPDLYFEKVVEIKLPEEKMGVKDGRGEMTTASSKGEVFWSRQVSLKLSCEMHLGSLPFDTQHCAVVSGLYSQRAEQVQLRWRDGFDAFANWRSTCLSGWIATGLVQENTLNSFTSGSAPLSLAHAPIPSPDACPPLPSLHYSDFTYARATVAFTRIPERFMQHFFNTSLLMVIISWLGFLIDPSATPARVTLGVVTLLVVLQNVLALSNSSPRDVSNTWLGQFTAASFYFNIAAFVEQILVNFGLQVFS